MVFMVYRFPSLRSGGQKVGSGLLDGGFGGYLIGLFEVIRRLIMRQLVVFGGLIDGRIVWWRVISLLWS